MDAICTQYVPELIKEHVLEISEDNFYEAAWSIVEKQDRDMLNFLIKKRPKLIAKLREWLPDMTSDSPYFDEQIENVLAHINK